MKHISSDLLKNTSLYRKVNYLDDRFPNIKIYGKCEQETTTGKQLFDIADGSYETAGTSPKGILTFKDGVATLSHNFSQSFGIKVPLRTPITLKANQSYTRANYANYIYPYIALYDVDSKSVDTMAASDNGVKTYTPTQDLEIYYIYFWFNFNHDYIEIKPMMVNGTYTSSNIPSFEKYTGCLPAPNPNYPMPIKTRQIGSIELCGTGTDRDYAYRNSGKWFKHKVISNVVLDGSENWAKGSKQTRNRYYVNNLINTIWNNNGIDIISNYFVCITPNQSDADYIGLSKFNAAGFMINFDLNNENFDTVAKFKTWLSTHNTEVFYILATPIEEEITDIPTINALEEIYANKIRERQEEIIVDEDID